MNAYSIAAILYLTLTTSLAQQPWEPDAAIVTGLLQTCKPGAQDSCNMCSLCQNGAFCQQQVKDAEPEFMKGSPMKDEPQNKTLNNRNTDLSDTKSALDYLRSMVDFTCYCVPGFTGTYCQLNIDECLSVKCRNNATCVDKINGFICDCPAGFKGEFCEINIDECASSPCMSGSECYDLIDGYYCKCLPGYTGRTCSIDIDECSGRPCFNNAKCLNLINKFECDCSDTGFTGQLCEINIDDCLDVKCQHNSTCIDGINTYQCDCHPGFAGQRCEHDIDECASSPCIEGTCWENSDQNSFNRRIQYLSNMPSVTTKRLNVFDLDGTQVTRPRRDVTERFIDLSFSYSFNYEKAAGYWCECTPGYTGVNCGTKIDECEHEPCGVNGKCLDLVNRFECVCYEGYQGKTCDENINECGVYRPCAESTQCIDLAPDYTRINKSEDTSKSQAGYKCDCTNLNTKLAEQNGNAYVSYTGQNCTVELNACQTRHNQCMHNSTCISIDNPHTNTQDIYCTCLQGYTGKYCQYTTSFRMDGTYAPQSPPLKTHNDSIILTFDFKVNFFHPQETKLPLIYFTDTTGNLVIAIIVHRHYLSIENYETGIKEHIAFYFPYNGYSKDYANIWHSLKVKVNQEMARIVYSVPKLHLTETKRVNFDRVTANNMSRFIIGKFYGVPNQEAFLNGACIRDVVLNDEYIFKTNPFMSLNPHVTLPVKYGCDHHDNSCGVSDKCANNSTCLHRWYTYECTECQLPFYGSYCHIETQKLGFIQPLSELVLVGDTSSQSISNMFKISFNLSRITKTTRPNQKIFFSTLKQLSDSEVTYYYLIGIDEYGFINLKKIYFDGNVRTTQWTLRNTKLNLNLMDVVRISLKLSDRFIEINLNDEFMSRFEIVDGRPRGFSRHNLFQISEIKFANTFLNNSELFLLYDLKIMEQNYEFLNENRNFKVNILSDENKSVANRFKVRKSANILLFKSALENDEVVGYLNENYCEESTESCFELNGSVVRIGFNRLLTSKTINCSRQDEDPRINQCEDYSVISRSLFPNLNNQKIQSTINYYFDFDTQLNKHQTTQLTPQPFRLIPSSNNNINNNQKIIGYSSPTHHSRLLKMRDINFYSIAFQLLINQYRQSPANTTEFAKQTNLLTLNTFDELSRNRIFLLGIDLEHSEDLIQLKLFTNHKSIKTEAMDPITIKHINLTFTFNTIQLTVDGHKQIQLFDNHNYLISKTLLKAYGSFMLNFTHTPEESNDLIREGAPSFMGVACVSELALATRKAAENGTDAQVTVYPLIRRTKSIFLVNDNAFQNMVCKQGQLENDEVEMPKGKDEDCFVIEKIDLETNEKLNNSYHCKCENEENCPYDFWTGQLRNDDRGGFKGCALAGDYACFNNGTCVDHTQSGMVMKNALPYKCDCQRFYTGERCETFDPCLDNPCSKDSICQTKILSNNQMTYECKCNEGFLGRNCTIDLSKTCFASPCQNGATCLNVTLIEDPQTLGYECMCNKGFEGRNCNEKIDFCQNYEPCQHGGKCLNLDIFAAKKFYSCNCPSGWSGVNCTRDVDECTKGFTNPCSGNGNCINTPGSFKCTCNEYFYGGTCEKTHACQQGPHTSRPCKNGALCLISGNIGNNEFECKCPFGFTGSRCEFATCDSRPCRHGAACRMLNSTNFECNCTGSHFFGPLCNWNEDQSLCLQTKCDRNTTCDTDQCDCDHLDCSMFSNSIVMTKRKDYMYHMILWPLLGLMLGLLMVLFSIFAMKMKKSRATHGTYSPSRHEQQASRIEFNMDLKRPPEERLI